MLGREREKPITAVPQATSTGVDTLQAQDIYSRFGSKGQTIRDAIPDIFATETEERFVREIKPITVKLAKVRTRAISQQGLVAV